MNGGEAVVEQQARQLQRRVACVRQGTPHRLAVGAECLGVGIVALTQCMLDRPDAPHVLLEHRFCLGIGLDDRLRRFFEVMELAELVRHIGHDSLDGEADRALPIRDHGMNGHRQRLLDLTEEAGKISFTRTVEAASEQDLARQTIAQHPQDVLALVGLQPINSEDDVALHSKALLEAGLVGQVQGHQFFVAGQQIRDSTRGDGDPTLVEVAMDLGDAAMVAIAQQADVGDHIQAKLTVRQGPCAFFLRAIRVLKARTLRIVTLEDGELQAADARERGNGPPRMVGHPERAATGRTGPADRAQKLGVGNRWTFRATCHHVPPTINRDPCRWPPYPNWPPL